MVAEVDAAAPASFEGPEPIVVSADPALLGLALGNGLRNALEAIRSLEGEVPAHPLVVSWGTTDVDAWVAILDKGPGLSGDVNSTFGSARTTKPGHRGLGLHIAQQAISSMEGTLRLTNSLGGGARFEIRWFPR
jgi:C4-dicarboxylate-specific signal transduction histidine kinase